MTEITFDLNVWQVVQLIVAVILPVVVGLVTTRVTNSNVKAVLLLVISGVTAFLTELLSSVNAGTSFDAATALLATLTTFIIGVALHYGLWKPVGVSAKAQAVGRHVE